MRLADGLAQTVCGLRHRDQVDVIGHEAIGPDLDLLGTTELGHELQVALVVLFAEQGLLPTVSTAG